MVVIFLVPILFPADHNILMLDLSTISVRLLVPSLDQMLSPEQITFGSASIMRHLTSGGMYHKMKPDTSCWHFLIGTLSSFSRYLYSSPSRTFLPPNSLRRRSPKERFFYFLAVSDQSTVPRRTWSNYHNPHLQELLTSSPIPRGGYLPSSTSRPRYFIGGIYLMISKWRRRSDEFSIVLTDGSSQALWRHWWYVLFRLYMMLLFTCPFSSLMAMLNMIWLTLSCWGYTMLRCVVLFAQV